MISTIQIIPLLIGSTMKTIEKNIEECIGIPLARLPVVRVTISRAKESLYRILIDISYNII